MFKREIPDVYGPDAHCRLGKQDEPFRFIECQRAKALYALDAIGLLIGGYAVADALARGSLPILALLAAFFLLLAAGNAAYFATRSFRPVPLLSLAAVAALTVAAALDSGRPAGFAFFILLPAFPLMYIIAGARAGAALTFTGGALMAARLLLSGSGILPGMVILTAYATLAVFIVAGRFEALTARLGWLAAFDWETGLPAKQRFEGALSERLSRPSATGLEEGFSVVGFRILNYNRIYAMQGPALCESMMGAVGERIRSWKNHVEISSRWQSSLFLSVIDTNDFLEVDTSCRELLAELTRPIVVEDRIVMLLCSIAITRFPDDADSADGLIGNVLSTLDRNSTMPDELIFFDRSKHEAERHRYRLFERLVKGDFAEGFMLHYQPKIRLSDGSCAGAEVLMRWNHPEYGFVSPAEFIAFAEEIGSIRRLTRTMISRVFDDLRRPEFLAAAGESRLTVAINLSIQDLKDPELLTFVNREMRRAGIEASTIEFEITEGSLIDDNPWIRINMENLLVLGFRLAIDDFGTGYSSLSYLHRLKVHDLKIDQSFVRELSGPVEGRGDSPVIDAILSMGKSLGLEVTAEGVETAFQASYLAERGCDLVQGWLYSKSLPFVEFTEYFKAHKRPQS